MSRAPEIKDAAKTIVLSYLQKIYCKKVNGQALSSNETSDTCAKKNLVQYVIKNMGYRKASTSSIDKAISELIVEKKVLLIDGYYQYVPPEAEDEQFFPILKMGKDISISPLPFSNLCFFEVSENYATHVAKYLNSRFFSDDIRIIPLGNLLLCLDIALPSDSKYVVKKKDIYSRVSEHLKRFNYAGYQVDDLHIKGITEEQLQLEHLEDELPVYGGEITNPALRRIRKK